MVSRNVSGDTASAASLLLAAEVHRQGFKVALAGEGSDEWLAGYPWHKAHRLMAAADVMPGLKFSLGVRRLLGAMMGALSVGVALGPLAAGAAYDLYGGYAQFLGLTIAAMVASSLALVTLK